MYSKFIQTLGTEYPLFEYEYFSYWYKYIRNSYSIRIQVWKYLYLYTVKNLIFEHIDSISNNTWHTYTKRQYRQLIKHGLRLSIGRKSRHKHRYCLQDRSFKLRKDRWKTMGKFQWGKDYVVQISRQNKSFNANHHVKDL
jgi:hypothetical protein